MIIYKMDILVDMRVGQWLYNVKLLTKVCVCVCVCEREREREREREYFLIEKSLVTVVRTTTDKEKII